MNSCRQIAEEAGVGVGEVWELMARACVERVGIPYCRITGDGRGVDAVGVYYAVCVGCCRPVVVLSTGDIIGEAVFDALNDK